MEKRGSSLDRTTLTENERKLCRNKSKLDKESRNGDEKCFKIRVQEDDSERTIRLRSWSKTVNGVTDGGEKESRQTYVQLKRRMCLCSWNTRKEEVKKKEWWRGQQRMKPPSLPSSSSGGGGGNLNSGAAAAGQLAAADFWTDCGRALVFLQPAAVCRGHSDSTRLRIDERSWQFNEADGWSALSLTSLKSPGLYGSRAQLLLTVNAFKQQ